MMMLEQVDLQRVNSYQVQDLMALEQPALGRKISNNSERVVIHIPKIQ